MHKKILSFLLAGCLLLLCCGYKPEQESNPPQDDTPPVASPAKTRDITLLYCEADTLNPYTCATKYNQELCDLLYDPLIKLDETYTVQNCLAESMDITPSSIVVRLKNAKFSNGTALQAADVQYSFALAKNSAQYKNAFATVSCTVANGSTVKFTLQAPDVNFVHFLDFPIIQAKSDTIKNSDNILQPPIGCGRYVYVYDQEQLSANADYHGGKVNIGTIHLIDAPDSTAASHYLEVGAVDYYYSDLADNVIPQLNGASQPVVLNKLVYIGINQNDPRLYNAQIRCTLSAALNRTELCSTAFHSNAVIAKSPFHPLWETAKGYQYIEEKENMDVVLANLKETGYNTKDTEGYFVNAAGERLSFSLLCPSSDALRTAAAEQIRDQLKKAGIALTVEVVPFAQFAERLAAGNFQLYLSEVQIPQNMDISSFTVPGGALAYGVLDETVPPATGSSAASSTAESQTVSSTVSDATSSGETISKTLAQAIAEYKNEQVSIFDVITVFNASMPVIPLCFKSGIRICASDFSTAPYATSSDVFYNIENATFK